MTLSYTYRLKERLLGYEWNPTFFRIQWRFLMLFLWWNFLRKYLVGSWIKRVLLRFGLLKSRSSAKGKSLFSGGVVSYWLVDLIEGSHWIETELSFHNFINLWQITNILSLILKIRVNSLKINLKISVLIWKINTLKRRTNNF